MRRMGKKTVFGVAALMVSTLLLTACGTPAAPAPADTKESGTKESTSAPASEDSGTAEGQNTEEGLLRLYGPGLFTAVGAGGTTDLVTGINKPGYQEVIDRWNELYPNVEVQIEAVPWDNWKAAVQTAALSGDYDILIHGNGNADFCLDLTEYIANDPEIKDNITFYPYRRNPDNMTEVKAYGLSYSLNPVLCVIDKEILGNYGVAIPDKSWTFEDLAEIAKSCTGTDPVTGNQTYGVSMCPANNAYKTYKAVSRGFDDVIFEFSPELKNTKVNFNNEKTIKVFDYIKTLGQYSSPDYLEGLNLSKAYTADHDMAMIWTDDIFNIYNTISAAGLTDRFMFLTLPVVEAGEHAGITSSYMQDLNISIYKDAKQKDLAWKFLKFLVTDPVVQQWFIDTYSIPANSKYADLLYDAMPKEYAEAIKEVIVTSPAEFDSSASVWYDSTWFGTLQSDLGNEFDQLLRGKSTSETAAQNIQKNIDTYLKSLE